MNDQTNPADPFGAIITHNDEPSPVINHSSASAGEQPEQDSRHNADALEHLRREIIAQPFRESERHCELAVLNAQRKPLSPAINIPERLRSDQASAASAAWGELDKLALIRAASWIVHADGYGIGITIGELDGIASRTPERIASTARQIVRRLSEIVTAPEADAMAISGSQALAGILRMPE
ncbi:hypothetical protein [Mangrovicoccus algicola]|uniref:Uncharacterized protein n=1 Tax=Mangrovicoccus algicola TaxID=2771008 RepID=A0A8J7CW23_9RHOB|nr:hypothetical protein [Mangrovicoccus algicola]MBE3637212.1 hypothetical protein [Mangrovicoccus algicola]